jgi:prepilin signal peptidase PulO-like enzyme (type II secretory pathway)
LPADWLAGSPALFVVACLVVGLLVGSFLNVVVYRVPIMLDRQWRAQCEELQSPRAALDLSGMQGDDKGAP